MLWRPHRERELAVVPGVLIRRWLGVRKRDLRHDPGHVAEVLGTAGHLDFGGEDFSGNGAQAAHRVEEIVARARALLVRRCPWRASTMTWLLLRPELATSVSTAFTSDTGQ